MGYYSSSLWFFCLPPNPLRILLCPLNVHVYGSCSLCNFLPMETAGPTSLFFLDQFLDHLIGVPRLFRSASLTKSPQLRGQPLSYWRHDVSSFSRTLCPTQPSLFRSYLDEFSFLSLFLCGKFFARRFFVQAWYLPSFLFSISPNAPPSLVSMSEWLLFVSSSLCLQMLLVP